MRGIRFFSILLIFAFVLPSMADESHSRARGMEPVVLQGLDLPQIMGSRINLVRVFCKKGGQWVPVPFQIDERVTKGRKKTAHYVFPPKTDPDPAFDEDDELVFLGRDLGEKATASEPALGQKATAEVEVRDPATGSAGYAYVMTFDNPPPLSDVDYITWNPETRSVEALGYTVGYPDGDALFFNSLSIPADRGGSGQNFVDTFKVRANGRIIVQLFVYDINNNDYRNTLLGVIDGPVRVIRRVKSNLNSAIFLVHRYVVEAVYYPEWFEMNVPVKMGVRGPTISYMADVRFSLDLNESAEGMTFVNPLNTEGVSVDGILGEAERNMNYGPGKWFAMSGKPGNLVVRMDQSKRSGARQDLYYLDDKEVKDPPENNAGQIGDAGWSVLNINRIPAAARVWEFRFFFPAAAQPPAEIMEAVDNPQAVTAGTKTVEAPPAPSPLVEQTRWKQESPRPSYEPSAIAERTRGYLPQLLIDPNLGYGSGFQVIERKTLGTDLSTDFLFLISHRAYQFYRLEEILNNTAGIDEWVLYIEYILHPNRYFYGIGNDQTPDDLTVFRQERFWVYLRMEKYFLDHLMVAFQPGAMHNSIGHGELFSGFEPSIEEKYGPPENIVGERFAPEVFGLKGGWTNSLRFDIALDYRDDKIYTRRGIFDILEVEYTPKWLGSDYEYLRYRLDLRFYFGGEGLNPEKTIPRNLWARLFLGSQTERVFAVRLVAQRMDANKVDFAGRKVADIPFFEQSYFGDANSSRGHYWAQWIDNDVTFAMFELRWHMWKIIDATLFYDIGRVWDNVYDDSEWGRTSFDDLHKSYGVGMRFKMVPSIMMRVDYGFSSENPGGLLYIYGWHTF